MASRQVGLRALAELLRCEQTIVAGRLLEPRPAPWIDA
jgi:hypothetical protein